MKRFLFCLGAVMFVSACQSTTNPYAEARQQLRQASAQSAQMQQECHANAAQYRTRVEYQRCLNAADAVFAAGSSPQAAVAMRWRMAQRMALAEKFDRRQITETQYQITAAAIDAEALSYVDRHSNYSRRPTYLRIR